MKPLMLGECILHFWKPPIFINLVLAGEDHTYVLNTQGFIEDRCEIEVKTPQSSYLEEGFSGIQNAAMVLISRDQINEAWRFPKM